MLRTKENLPKTGGFPLESNKTSFKSGLRDGMPIALGYFAVAFTLGITAKNAGFTAIQAALSSLFNHASAGEYAVISMVAASGTYWEMAIMALVANIRYLLMSAALSQKLSPQTPMRHRVLVAFGITDEIFGVSIAVKGWLNPWYSYGAMVTAFLGWSMGSYLGVVVGNILPLRAVSALSVGLYGMFIAIITPPSRKDKVVLALVLISFAASFLVSVWPLLAGISSGMKTILLTVIISLGAAVLFPIKIEETEAQA